MVEIIMDTFSRTLETLRPDELHQQVRARRQDGIEPCVTVRVQVGDIGLTLRTHACGGGGSVGIPRPAEQKIIDRWLALGLNQPGWTSGNLLAFLKQLEHFV